MTIESNLNVGAISANHMTETQFHDSDSPVTKHLGTMNRCSHRITRFLLPAVLGLIPAVSSATSPHMPPGRGNPNPGVPPNCISANQIGNQNPGVHPPCSKPYGLTYGAWSAKWWQWMLAIPLPVNPNFDGTPGDPDPTTVQDCAQGQDGQVWFLGGRFNSGDTTERTCTLPNGKAILFPIANIVFGDGWFDCNGKGPFHDPTLPSCDAPGFWSGLQALAASLLSLPGEVTVDGVPLKGLGAYRAQAPQFDYTLPPNNIFNAFDILRPAGTYGPAGSDGYWIMLTPLSPGQHWLHFKSADGFQDIRYHLIVGQSK